jgi:hypothetical protein
MRLNCDWFAERASMQWRRQPGRSMLLLVPQGCDETITARQVAEWTKANFRLPFGYADLSYVIVRLTSDSFQTSEHFALALARALSRQVNLTLNIEQQGDFPSDILEAAVEGTINAGAFPVVIIERFHAFATIRDGGMSSVLSRMRSLEHNFQLTTLAISPLGYDSIRSAMASELPFLNSVYGDNRDRAVMTPLSRADFVAAAVARGIMPATANRLYSKGGGPDVLYEALLDAAHLDDVKLPEECIAKAGTAIRSFLTRSFSSVGPEVLCRLALGNLSAPQEAFLLDNPLWPFIARRTRSGGLACSSPLLARLILRGNEAK